MNGKSNRRRVRTDHKTDCVEKNPDLCPSNTKGHYPVASVNIETVVHSIRCGASDLLLT